VLTLSYWIQVIIKFISKNLIINTMAGENVHVPDLLLVYGPIRSHLGFPAWRLRYTEIVYVLLTLFLLYL